jgi:6-phosphogluconolactonase
MQISAGHFMFIGSYTNPDILAHEPKSSLYGEGISLVHLSESGELTLKSITPALNPAVLHIHPKLPVLYAIAERIDTNGLVYIYNIGEDMSLSLQQTYGALGKSTCYMGINAREKRGILSNYWDSRIDTLRLSETGEIEGCVQSFFQHAQQNYRQVTDKHDHWANRQVGPHAHSVHFWHQWVFIPDLGEDAIFQYDFIDQQLANYQVNKLAAGSGPRHMVIHPCLDIAYVSNELASTVTMGLLDNTEPQKFKSRFIPMQYISTLPEQCTVENYVSELSLSPDGRFLYVSNRGHNSLALLSIDQANGNLNLVANFSTEGQFPRHFALSPDGKFIVVANQNSNAIKVFARDAESGRLKYTGHKLATNLPNFIRFY